MASSKKDKGASAPEARECANCLTPEGQHGVTLKACTRCKATHYCGRACQTAHWRAGHKQFCVTPKERAPKPTPSVAPVVTEYKRANECAICLDPFSSGDVCTLPCTHTFHAACVEGLRSFGVKQVCPMCRMVLPPGPEKLYTEAMQRYLVIAQRSQRGATSWGALTNADQREMDEVVSLWREAAELGYAEAQYALGKFFDFGSGVKKDYSEAFKWYHKAADQGHAVAHSI